MLALSHIHLVVISRFGRRRMGTDFVFKTRGRKPSDAAIQLAAARQPRGRSNSGSRAARSGRRAGLDRPVLQPAGTGDGRGDGRDPGPLATASPSDRSRKM